MWQLFLDSCSLQGATGALKRIPEGSHPAYATALGEGKRLLWDQKKLWGFWQEALKAANFPERRQLEQFARKSPAADLRAIDCAPSRMDVDSRFKLRRPR